MILSSRRKANIGTLLENGILVSTFLACAESSVSSESFYLSPNRKHYNVWMLFHIFWKNTIHLCVYPTSLLQRPVGYNYLIVWKTATLVYEFFILIKSRALCTSITNEVFLACPHFNHRMKCLCILALHVGHT